MRLGGRAARPSCLPGLRRRGGGGGGGGGRSCTARTAFVTAAAPNAETT